jgi:DNA repair exonuclease SbcCD ATPase subunit
MKGISPQNLNEMDLGSDNYLPSEVAPDWRAIGKPFRLNLWEINDSLKCPVIGTCLDITEQKQILKKEGISVKNESDFEIHEIIVASSESEDGLSRRVDSWLNRKFKKEITAFSELEENEFIQLWKSRLKDGTIECILWIAATRSDLSSKAMREIFGDIHMEMHLNARKNREKRQRLDYQQEKNQILAQRLKEAAKTKRSLTKENERLKKELSNLCQVSAFLEKEKKELELELTKLREESMVAGLLTKNHELQGLVKRLSEEIRDYQKKVTAIKSQKDELSSKLDIQREMSDHLRKELERNNTQASALNRPREAYSSFNLRQKRFLIVGGISKMESLYRQLIEENGGIFEYNDGYMKGGTKGLENQLRRSDLVLCLINYNSHAASLAVKRFGKKYSKPFRMLANSSLSTIFQALLEYQEGASIQ